MIPKPHYMKFDIGHRPTQKNTDKTKSSLIGDHSDQLRGGVSKCNYVFIATDNTPHCQCIWILTAYQTHHTNGKQQMGINMSVCFCVSLWLIFRVYLNLNQVDRR